MRIENEVLKIVKNIVPNKKVTLESELYDELQFDSLLIMTLLIKLEEKFEFELLGEAININFEEISTVKDIFEIIDSNYGSKR